jgi:hypothetical protein
MSINRRKFLQAATAPFFCPFFDKASAQVKRLSGALQGMQWKPLKIGGGGWVMRFSSAKDGTIICKTDSSYPYIWNASTSIWSPIQTPTSIPAAYLNAIIESGSLVPYASFEGCVYDAAVDPNNGKKIFMFFYKNLFVSSDSGRNFTQTAYPTVSSAAIIQGDIRGQAYRSQHIAVDPFNSDIVFASDSVNIFASNDGMKTTPTQLNPSPIANALNQVKDSFNANTSPGGYCIVFDPNVQGTVYINSYGNHIYKTTDGGANWSQLSGGPSKVYQFAIGADSALWAVDDSGSNLSGGNTNVWSYSSGTWKQWTQTEVGTSRRYPVAYHSVAISPGASQPIAVANLTGNVSIYNGLTWTGTLTHQRASGDVPWMAVTNTGVHDTLSCTDIMFDPLDHNKLWFATGIGVWATSSIPRSSPFTLPATTAGIENLVAWNVVSTPNYSSVLVGAMDRPLFKITNPDTYQTSCLINTAQIVHCRDLEYTSSDPRVIVGLILSKIRDSNNIYPDYSGYTNDGGTTWNKFATAPVYFHLTTNTPTTSGNVIHFAAADAARCAIMVGQYINTASWGGTHQVVSVSGGDVRIDGSPVSNSSGADVEFFTGYFGGCLAATTPNNIIIVPALTPYPIYTKDGGASWAIIDLTGLENGRPTPTGYSSDNGWYGGNGIRNYIVTADREVANTFYLYCNPPTVQTWTGMYKSTDNGDSWHQQSSVRIPSTGSSYQGLLQAPPYYSAGHSTAEHLFYADGYLHGMTPLNFSSDGGQNWASVANVQQVRCYGFGKPKPYGNGYPTIYLMGKYNGKWGYWRGDNFDYSTRKANWTQIGNVAAGNSYPGDQLEAPTCISGDANIYGKVYIGMAGSGFVYGTL